MAHTHFQSRSSRSDFADFDICIRGAGIVGRTLALLLARERLRVALVVPPPQPPQHSPSAPSASAAGQADVRADVRAYALNGAARQLLQGLRVWPEAHQATAVQQMQVFGDSAGAMVQFDAASLGQEALAWIVDVPALEQRLAEAARYQPQIEIVPSPVPAPLTIISEGRASRTRQELGIEFGVTPYHQTAIATRLTCELPHGQVARQWFSPEGIVAFLPLDGEQGRSVALVWSVPQAQLAQWQDADEDSFTAALEDISQGALGRLQVQGARMQWPLQQALAQRWCGTWPRAQQAQAQNCGQSGQSWVLAGDAAHNVHPLAGQGLNLGLADAQALAQVLQQRPSWRSVGDMKLLRQYERQRKAHFLPLSCAMDGIWQIFAHPDPRLHSLRNWGLNQFERSAWLKSWSAQQAMGVELGQPPVR